MIYTIIAWEIDAAIVTIAVDSAHRYAARVFVARPCPSTGRALSAARSLSRAIARLSAVPHLRPTR